MKHTLSVPVVAALCALCVASGPAEVSAGGAANAAALSAHRLGGQDALQHRGILRRVDDCKRRRFYNPGVFLDGGLDHLDPNYGGINHGECLDPPDYRPAPRRLSCRNVRELLRERGYRRIRSYDCKGSVYGFRAERGSKRYKLRVRSRSGRITSRKRI